MPEDFQDAAAFFPQLPEDLHWIIGVTGPGDFEILYKGSLDQIENPSAAIILREKEPFNIKDSGEADRTYLFADGHSEVHRAPAGNFEPWESQHSPKLKDGLPDAVTGTP